ncbi:hypothetical protein KGQ19_26875 [Catenulispora sp. NL8]|uniref:Uncharacterized protein n=1 Tax=Catenulispora pinistramenti TaxID=2705254 RepID=A0ABS5KX17_9ACTN|nr:hypothetical protein [Catenulispora pinistramenti]MBS2550500.1 hypothetical protein [Catenulispora pinistramenti]
MTDPLAQVRIDLRNGARIVLANGLHQRAFYNYDQVQAEDIPPGKACVCGVGGLNTGITGHPIPDDFLTNPRISAALAHLIAYMMAFYATTFISWNDEEGRTTAEVARLLRKAAAWTPPTAVLAVTV